MIFICVVNFSDKHTSQYPLVLLKTTILFITRINSQPVSQSIIMSADRLGETSVSNYVRS